MNGLVSKNTFRAGEKDVFARFVSFVFPIAAAAAASAMKEEERDVYIYFKSSYVRLAIAGLGWQKTMDRCFLQKDCSKQKNERYIRF